MDFYTDFQNFRRCAAKNVILHKKYTFYVRNPPIFLNLMRKSWQHFPNVITKAGKFQKKIRYYERVVAWQQNRRNYNKLWYQPNRNSMKYEIVRAIFPKVNICRLRKPFSENWIDQNLDMDCSQYFLRAEKCR